MDQERCLHCGLCHRACEDGGHQSIGLRRNGHAVVDVNAETCVGCGLCAMVCPVDGCITMVETDRAPIAHDRPIPA